MKGGAAVIETLIAHGVDTAFTVSGESFLYALDAMRQRTDKLRLVPVRQEGGGTFAAEAYGKLAGRPAAVFVSRGPGSTNAAIGVHTARQDSTPLLLFVGHVNSHVMGKEGFQEVDQRQFMGGVAKAVLQPETPDDIARVTAEAVRLSTDGRPGPIVVQIPRDVAAADTEAAIPAPTARVPHLPEADGIAAAATMIDEATAPLVVAGEMIANQDANAALAGFAAAAGVPVMSAYRRQDVMANSHPNYAGHLEINRVAYQVEAIEAADLVIAVGTRLDGITTADNTVFSVGKPHIHIHPDREVLDRFSADPKIDADMAPALNALADRVGAPDAARQARTAALHDAFMAFSHPGNFPAHGEVDLARVADVVGRVVDDETTVLTDGGSFSRWIHRYRRFEKPHTKAGPMSGAMGYAVPGAIGAKLARPDHEAIAFVGDGGFVMTGQEMITAVEQNIPIKVIVCDNAAHGSIMAGQHKTFGTDADFVTALRSPDFAAVGAAYGAGSFRVERTDEFEPAFRAALDHDGPALIHLLTDRRDIVPYGNEREAV